MNPILTYPTDKILLLSRSRIIDHSSSCDDLQEHDAEAVYIGHCRQLACKCILRRAVAVSPHHSCGHMSLVSGRAELGKAKIGELWIEILIQ